MIGGKTQRANRKQTIKSTTGVFRVWIQIHLQFHLEFRLAAADKRLVLRHGEVSLSQKLVGNPEHVAPTIQRHPLALRAALDRAVRPHFPLLGFLVGVHAPGTVRTRPYSDKTVFMRYRKSVRWIVLALRTPTMRPEKKRVLNAGKCR